MNKKLLIVISLFLITTVTYLVTTEKAPSKIAAAKEKLQSNLALEEEAKRESLANSKSKNGEPFVTETTSYEPPQKALLDDSFPDEKNKIVPEKADQAGVSVPEKRRRKRRRIFPPKEVISRVKTGTEDSNSANSAIRGGGGGATVISGSPRIFVVTESGEGEAYVLMEAIRLLNPGDKIELKNGTYSLLIGHLSVPDFEIAGEGEGTLLELPETLKLLQQNLTFRNLKLANTSTGAAVEIRNDKKLTLQNVELQGNGNDCLEVSKGQVVANDSDFKRCNRAIYLKSNSTGQISGITISDSDYGIFHEGENAQTITNLKAENINLFSVFFAPGSSGNVTCISCTLTDNSTNRKTKLILKAAN